MGAQAACCKDPSLADGDSEVLLPAPPAAAGGDSKPEAKPEAASYAVQESCKKHDDRLKRILMSRPYLEKEHHGLHQYVVAAREEIATGVEEAAENALITLDLEIKAEEHLIAAAFQKFDHSGDEVLQGNEIQFMLDYLGFPCTDKDVAELMKTVDIDNDNSVSYNEFITYVGFLGGSGKLFELRRGQIEDRHKGSGDAKLTKEELKFQLTAMGMTEEALAYWQLTANPSELEQAAMLKDCQRRAVRHIRNLAKESHNKALPKLQERVKTLGFTDVDLHMSLAWVRELAPMIIHVKLDKLGDLFAKDTHYRNQFETSTSAGLLKPAARVRWEKGLFGTAYEPETPGFDRPKYGVQNIWNDHRGVMGCNQYGDSYLVLKDVRLRCTMSPEDSANLPAKRLAVPDYYAHVLMEYSDKELAETLRVAKGGDEQLGDSRAVIEKWGKYKEVQIHGEVDFKKHVERLVVHQRHASKKKWVNEIAKVHGWKVTFMDDYEKELKQKAGGREMNQKTWEDKLQYLKQEAEIAVKAREFVREHEAGPVSWQFQIKDGWQIYGKATQAALEDAYQKYLASPSPATASIEMAMKQGKRKWKLVINFEEMVQQVKGNERKRQLQRLVL